MKRGILGALLFLLPVTSACDDERTVQSDTGVGVEPCAKLDVCACLARQDCQPVFSDCVCPCVDYQCPDCPAAPAPCSCGGGQFVRCQADGADAGVDTGFGSDVSPGDDMGPD